MLLCVIIFTVWETIFLHCKELTLIKFSAEYYCRMMIECCSALLFSQFGKRFFLRDKELTLIKLLAE
jgi:hypothetical protein